MNWMVTQGGRADVNMLTRIKLCLSFSRGLPPFAAGFGCKFDPLFFRKHVCLLSSDKLAVKSHLILPLDRSVIASHTSMNILSALNTFLAPIFYPFKQNLGRQSEAAAAVLRWTRKETETGTICQFQLLPSVEFLISVQHSWSLFWGNCCETACADRSETVDRPLVQRGSPRFILLSHYHGFLEI